MVFTLAEAQERFNKTLLSKGELLSLMHALGDGSGEVRIIGGAVRNVLRNEPINDLDLATIHPPKEIIKRVEKAGFKCVPTGIDHGTITAVGEKSTYEITTLRQDISTDGRHAEVKFGTDWKEDALRRDFTMNALAVDARGNLHDLVDGLDDCLNGKVRFIGDAKQRIKEDALRILRFVRFSAFFSDEALDLEGLKACSDAHQDLNNLSVERIQQEIVKLLSAPDIQHLSQVLMVAGDAHILPWLDISQQSLARMKRTKNGQSFFRLLLLQFDELASLPLLLAALKFPKKRVKQAAQIAKMVEQVQTLLNQGENYSNEFEALAYYGGVENLLEALELVAVAAPEYYEQCIKLNDQFKNWQKPRFPISGNLLLKGGIPQGERLGGVFKELEVDWVHSSFKLSQNELLEVAKKSI